MFDVNVGTRYRLRTDWGVGEHALLEGGELEVVDVVEAGAQGVGLSAEPTILAAYEFETTVRDAGGVHGPGRAQRIVTFAAGEFASVVEPV